MLACLTFQAAAQDKEGEETIKVSTELVSVPVVVTDKDGKYVPELKREDFEVFQDGAKQPIDYFLVR